MLSSYYGLSQAPKYHTELTWTNPPTLFPSHWTAVKNKIKKRLSCQRPILYFDTVSTAMLSSYYGLSQAPKYHTELTWTYLLTLFPSHRTAVKISKNCPFCQRPTFFFFDIVSIAMLFSSYGLSQAPKYHTELTWTYLLTLFPSHRTAVKI